MNGQMNSKSSDSIIGRLRASKEITEVGCLLMLNGLCEVIQPLTWIAGLVNGGVDENGDPTTITTGLPFGTLFGYCCCVAVGVMAVLVGYAAAFNYSPGTAKLTTFVEIFVQSAYILTVTSCMGVTRIASRDGSFQVPPFSLPETEPNNKLLAAMGVLAIIPYWFGMLGSISVLLGALSRFQRGRGYERDGNYYAARLSFYSFVLFLGGLAQTVVGIHLYQLHGAGPIPDNRFYKVAMLVVTYPAISITVGTVQMANGLWGMLKNRVPFLQSNQFVTSIWAGWFIQLVLQAMVQPSVLPGATAARAPPTLTAFAFGMNFMPAYLDSKAKSLPEMIFPEYYGEQVDESSRPIDEEAQEEY